MNFTGYNVRSINTQTGTFGYNFGVSMDTSTGKCIISLSGDNNNILSYTLQSGEVRDNDGRFIYGYQTGQNFFLGGYASQGNYNTYANFEPISFFGTRPTGYIEWLVVDCQKCSPSINFSLSGHLPNLTIPYIQFSSGQITGTGYIQNNNNSLKFRFFTGFVTTGGNYTIVTIPTGDITGLRSFLVQSNFNPITSAQLSTFVDSNEFTFETNFGDYTTTINIPWFYSLTQNLNATFPGSYSGSGIISESYIYWQNLVGAATYFPGLSGKIIVSGNSGLCTGNFGKTFTVKTGNLDETRFVNLPFVTGHGFTGFTNSGMFTYAQSGVAIRVTQISGTSTFPGHAINTFSVSFSGYLTGITGTITGFN